MISPRLTNIQQDGFSYIEVLVAVMIIAVCLVPAKDALRSAISAVHFQEEKLVDSLALQAKMAEITNQSFTDLSTAALAAGSIATPSSFSDPAPVTTTDGRQIRRLVYLSLYDGDNVDGDNNPLTGIDNNLLLIRITLEGSGQTIESLSVEIN